MSSLANLVTILVVETKALLWFSPRNTSHALMVTLQLFTGVLPSFLLQCQGPGMFLQDGFPST